MKQLKEEAIRRMEVLKIHDEGPHTCLGDFRKNGTPWKSEFYGILYYLDEEEKERVKIFEEKYKEYEVLVYHCYKAHTEFGEILYMLYCSNQEHENEDFNEDIKDNIIHCYADNLTDLSCSEFGSCYIKSMFGGIQLN